jgi:hypothetical protein
VVGMPAVVKSRPGDQASAAASQVTATDFLLTSVSACPILRRHCHRLLNHVMKTQIALFGIALAVLFSVIPDIDADAKDINLGWSGQGSWSTLLTSPRVREGSSKKKD